MKCSTIVKKKKKHIHTKKKKQDITLKKKWKKSEKVGSYNILREKK